MLPVTLLSNDGCERKLISKDPKNINSQVAILGFRPELAALKKSFGILIVAKSVTFSEFTVF